MAGCVKAFSSVLCSIMLLDCLKLCRVFRIWFLTERKSSTDCSVEGAAGKMLELEVHVIAEKRGFLVVITN